MRIVTNDSVVDCEDLIFDLETLVTVWADMITQHCHMSKCVKEQTGKTESIAKGLEIAMTFCKREIEVLLDKHVNENNNKTKNKQDKK